MAAHHIKWLEPDSAAYKSHQRGREDDEWEGQVEEENGDESGRGNAHHHLVGQHPAADANDRLDHHRHDGRLQPKKQPLHQRHLLKPRIQNAEKQNGEEARQDEEDACHQPAPCAMQQPAQIGGQLLRFGAGEQHAVVEGV